MTRLKEALEKAGSPLHPDAAARLFETRDPSGHEPWQLDSAEPQLSIVAETSWQEEFAARSNDAADDQRRASMDSGGPSVAAVAANDFWDTYRFGKTAQGKVVVGPNANRHLIEQYRKLGAALHHHQLQGAARTLMVTSAVAAEGKTLTATNLALTLSNSYQRRVLLVDADLRRPSVHDVLNVPNVTGLGDSLRYPDRGFPRYQGLSANLSVLTAGRPDSDPMAGLVSDTMNRILTSAAAQFDWVIVDTPPVALLPDANLLAAMIDTALLVVSAKATPYPMILRAVQAIGEQRILGVVLNRMNQSEIVSPYGYENYGYLSHGSAPKRWSRFLPWKKANAAAAL
jgi:protein-tyrosine kinase